MTEYYGINFHFESVPKMLQEKLSGIFMKYRNEVVEIFNRYIDKVNRDFDKTGKPCALGDFAEDLNPEYVEFINDRIQPHIDDFNDRYPFKYFMRFKLDECGDIVGYIPGIKDSKIWITLKEV